MENHEYSTWKVEVVEDLREMADAAPGSGELTPTGRMIPTTKTRYIIAPKGTLGLMLIEVHFKATSSFGFKGFRVLDEIPITTVIRYDDRYRGQF